MIGYRNIFYRVMTLRTDGDRHGNMSQVYTYLTGLLKSIIVVSRSTTAYK